MLSIIVPGCQIITNDGLTQSGRGCFYRCVHVASMGMKSLTEGLSSWSACLCVYILMYLLRWYAVDNWSTSRMWGRRCKNSSSPGWDYSWAQQSAPWFFAYRRQTEVHGFTKTAHGQVHSDRNSCQVSLAKESKAGIHFCFWFCFLILIYAECIAAIFLLQFKDCFQVFLRAKAATAFSAS